MILVVPVVILVCLLIPAIFKRSRIFGSVIISFCALAMSALPGANKTLANTLHVSRRLQELGGPSPEARYLTEFAGLGRSSYARIGSNNDDGHAVGLRGFVLACPYFHQYAFTPPGRLDEVVACAARANFLIVHLSPGDYASRVNKFLPIDSDFGRLNSNWKRFESNVENMLSRSFICISRPDNIRICKNRIQH